MPDTAEPTTQEPTETKVDKVQFVDDFADFKRAHGTGFSDRQLSLLEEYSRFKAILKPDQFSEWFQKKLKEVEANPEPKFEVLKGMELRPVKFQME